MDLFTCIKTRRSVRRFQDKPIPKEELEHIVKAGIWAPSSMNRQPWRFAVVSGSAVRKKLTDEAKAELRKFLETDEAKKKWGEGVSRFMERAKSPEDIIFYNAPSIIFVIRTKNVGNGNFDLGLCTMNMLLAAHDLGIGSVPVGLARPMSQSEIVREQLKMKPDEELIIALPMGYPAETPAETERNFGAIDWI